ncbi:MAG: LLM class flavin-dependent oxidoreductase [Betaproteobacteria bacterium]|jgi:luciferase family oxidoreductase group 1|nr:MAG: LLM class flavin-dependent oxidoreductase [Betaproteobacteria bacterium]
MRLSVLDQSPIIHGHSPAEAVRETIKLAKAAEELGYHRYWLAEHHNMHGLADPCPEILLGAIGSATSRIRVGTGGVLLPYYSPAKIAEIFRMHEALFPGRIDLGIGRAPGGDMLTAKAINPMSFYASDAFPQQVVDLVGWLDDKLPEDHPFKRVRAMPTGAGAPEVWLLGSSDYSANLAAHLGLRFAFAHFINACGGDEVSRAYRHMFQPSTREPTPHSLVCVFVICAQTNEEAERLAAPIDHRRVLMATGRESLILTTKQALGWSYSQQEAAIIRRERARVVLGTPDTVRERLLQVQRAYEADELMIITITGDYASRLQSYQLLAEAFDLQPTLI